MMKLSPHSRTIPMKETITYDDSGTIQFTSEDIAEVDARADACIEAAAADANKAYADFAEKINELRSPDFLSAAIAPETLLTADAFAQLMMHHLGDDDTFDSAEKLFWVEAAEYLGPDWLAKLVRVTKFMAQVDKA